MEQEKPLSHAAFIRLYWGVPERLSEALGLKQFAARFWFHRDSIPPENWIDIAALLEKREPDPVSEAATLKTLAEGAKVGAELRRARAKRAAAKAKREKAKRARERLNKMARGR